MNSEGQLLNVIHVQVDGYSGYTEWGAIIFNVEPNFYDVTITDPEGIYNPFTDRYNLNQPRVILIYLQPYEEPEPSPDGEPPTPSPSLCMIAFLFGATCLSRAFPYLRMFRDRVLPKTVTKLYYALSRVMLYAVRV